MYTKHKGSKPISLYGGLTAWIPPVGKVFDHFTGEIVETGVHSRSSKKLEQFWERQPLPNWYNAKRRAEERVILDTGNPDFFIEECEEYRRQEWFRRLNGFWFMNKGEPTYITGLHYFYLNWWQIDIGFPWYFDYDRKRFYHAKYCEDDPLSYGRLEVGPRRLGKTYFGGVWTYEPTSRTMNSNAGIQSKTKDDGKKVFGKALVTQFRKLPHFFRPVFDTSAGSIPKTEIRFFNTSQKGKSIRVEDMEEELGSIIDFRSSGKFAYDGEKLLRKLDDEIFKTEEVDVYERYLVNKECLVDNITETIIGKYMGTSTVEEVEGQLETYKKMWDESDPNKRDANGHTESGLYHYFISAAETRKIDKYGNADIDRNMKTILNTIEGFGGDSKKISDYKRKYPLNIREAFKPKSDDCHYDLQKLEQRYDILGYIEPNWITGDLRWIDINDITKGVKFVQTKNGKFKINKDLDLEEGNWNNVIMKGNVPWPKNQLKFVGGNDSFDNKTTVDGRKSNGSTTIFYKFDPLNPDKSDKFVMIYCYRPKKPSIFYEDTLKAAWFFGCEVLIETNKQGIIHYFDGSNPWNMKFNKFMMNVAGRKEPGIPTTSQTHDSIVNHTAEYIQDCVHLVDYTELIEDWMKFDINNTTKFDLSMSSGINLIAADRPKKTKVVKENKYTDISDIAPIY